MRSSNTDAQSISNRVYDAVVRIPRGFVVSYGAVARAIGRPRAARAVGNILNKNRNPQIPCHRVIRSDGTIGGYAWGTQKKNAILTREGVKISHGRVPATYILHHISP